MGLGLASDVGHYHPPVVSGWRSALVIVKAGNVSQLALQRVSAFLETEVAKTWSPLVAAEPAPNHPAIWRENPTRVLAQLVGIVFRNSVEACVRIPSEAGWRADLLKSKRTPTRATWQAEARVDFI